MLMISSNTVTPLEKQPITLSLSTYAGAKTMLADTKTDQSDLFKRTVNYIENHKASILYSSETNIVQG